MSSPLNGRQRGIALLEAMLAVVIMAVGLFGAVGMQARAMSALSDAGLRAEATLAGDRLVGIMSTDLNNLDQYALAAGATPGARLSTWYAETRTAIPNATIVIAITPTAGASESRVDLSMAWQRKTGDQTNTHNVTFYLAPQT